MKSDYQEGFNIVLKTGTFSTLNKFITLEGHVLNCEQLIGRVGWAVLHEETIFNMCQATPVHIHM